MATFEEKRYQRRKDMNNHTGLILLGNSGVGKSFLANILAGYDSFIHGISSKAVTKESECIEIEMGNSSLTIFNIPGLIEAEQEHIDLNKIEIDKAFYERPNSIVMFVFGHQNGRIRDEDVVAFNAINDAYSFQSQSLAILVNNLPQNRPNDHQSTTVPLIQKLLKNTEINSKNIYFIDTIDSNSKEDKERLQDQLLMILMELTPTKHQKKQTINTLMKELQICKEIFVEQTELFDEERQKLKEEVKDSEQNFNKRIAQNQSQLQSLQNILNNKNQKFYEEQHHFDEQMTDQRGNIEQATNELKKIKKKLKFNC